MTGRAHKAWLVAVDGSETSNAAVELALNTMKEGDHLILLHASKHEVEHDAAGKKALDDSESLAKSLNKSVKVETYFQKTNNIAEEIVLQAKLLGADYLVTGQRGTGQTPPFHFGSVTDYVSRHSIVPVLITHAPYLNL